MQRRSLIAASFAAMAVFGRIDINPWADLVRRSGAQVD